MNPQDIPQDDTLVRLELLGNLAKACRLALAEFEQADTVDFHVTAHSGGLIVDCQLIVNGQAVSGWGL